MTTPRDFYTMRIPEVLPRLETEEMKTVYEIIEFAIFYGVSIFDAANRLQKLEEEESNAVEQE